MTHNEALALLDIAAVAAVTAVGLDAPPTSPAAGACWIVGAAPIGAWAGQAHALAGWTAGGWRFVAAREGMVAWSLVDAVEARFRDGAWRLGEVRGTAVMIGGTQVVGAQTGSVPGPSGGATIDLQARAAIDAILAALRTHGLIGT